MEDRTGDAPSSEELIRRARMGLGGDASMPDTGDADAGLERFASAQVEPTAPVEPPPPSTPSPDPVGDAGPPPADSGSLLPEHFRPENETRSAEQSSSFGWARWVIPIGVVGYILFNVLTADTAVDDLSIGDCFLNPTEIEITTVETVDCAETHDYEVFAFVDLDERSGAFPGDDVLFEEAADRCLEPFLAYTGIDLDTDTPGYLYDVFIPDRRSWDDGNRESMCAIFAIDAGVNPIPSSGSARGS